MPTSEPQPTRPTPGMTVTSKFHEEWGAGTVLLVQGERANVLFTQHPTRKPVTVPVKSLIITRAGAWDSAARAMQARERAAAARSIASAAPKKRTYAKTTQEQAVQAFLARYPGGFEAEAYVEAERKVKLEAHRAFAEQLGGDTLRELLAQGKTEEVVQHALAAEKLTSLLSVFERARLAKGLREDTAHAEQVFSALADVLAQEVPEEKTFGRYLELLQALPSKAASQRAITWPIATVLPFLASPERFFFLKPRATQAAAERLRFDLQYEAAPTWTTYARALELAGQLRSQLAGHGCRDLLDVQAFIAVAG